MKRWARGLLAIWLTGLGTVAGEALAQLTETTETRSGMVFVALPKGCFPMGPEKPVPAAEDWPWETFGFRGHLSHDELPRHEVCLDAFAIGKHEVTAAQWQRVMGTPAPAGHDDQPAARVSWQAAREFAQRLSQLSGARYRLPTEAEWEYACRAGARDEAVPVGDALAGRAWYSWGGVRRPAPQPVGELSANAWGLHDMLGNVWEWTADSYYAEGYRQHVLHNPLVADAAPQKVIRGGSFRTEPRQVRCAGRGRHAADAGMDVIGFRLVREMQEKQR